MYSRSSSVSASCSHPRASRLHSQQNSLWQSGSPGPAHNQIIHASRFWATSRLFHFILTMIRDHRLLRMARPTKIQQTTVTDTDTVFVIYSHHWHLSCISALPFSPSSCYHKYIFDKIFLMEYSDFANVASNN